VSIAIDVQNRIQILVVRKVRLCLIDCTIGVERCLFYVTLRQKARLKYCNCDVKDHRLRSELGRGAQPFLAQKVDLYLFQKSLIKYKINKNGQKMDKS
jgi:hypothetical protein